MGEEELLYTRCSLYRDIARYSSLDSACLVTAARFELEPRPEKHSWILSGVKSCGVEGETSKRECIPLIEASLVAVTGQSGLHMT